MFSDESRQEESNVRKSAHPTKNKDPLRFEDPIKHSVKEFSTDSEVAETHGSRLTEALMNYRMKIVILIHRGDRSFDFNTRPVRELEPKLADRN